MSIKGNPKICPKPCPSVSFCLKPVEIEETVSKDSSLETETESFWDENTFSYSEQEQTQLGESFSNPEVEPFCLKPVEIEETVSKDSFLETETESFWDENTFSYSEQEQTQLGESFSNPEVESDNLSESDIGPFAFVWWNGWR